MKAITLWRPWDQTFFLEDEALRKTVENRPWAPPRTIRGELLALHAGLKWDQRGADAIEQITGITYRKEDSEPGVAVGVVRVVGWITRGGLFGLTYNWTHPGDYEPLIYDAAHSRWFFGPNGWVTAEPYRLPTPVPCEGAQGLWELPPDVDAEVQRQMREARGL